MFSVFGEYDYPFRLETGPIRIEIAEEEGFFTYHRSSDHGEVHKIISGKGGKIVISPVEPVNLPEEVTKYLEIRFTPIAIEPDSVQEFYLKFPIETGIFLKGKGEGGILDIVGLTRPKYSLYGTPDDGIITRYYESPLYDRIPACEALREGVLSLTVRNSSRGWMEVSRVVIDCSSLSLYYNDMVTMAGQMEIFSREIADVRIDDRPLMKDMRPANLLSKARKTIIPDKIPFTMEYGAGE
ncbi:MAG: DUF432 domain-containing protein [Methanoregulaceae archaeon]|nr:DUF432 domain-containing protein [Methanoregulaceae archaeon]